MSDELQQHDEAPEAPEAGEVRAAQEPQAEAPSGAAAFFGPFFNAILAPAQTWQALDANPKLSVWIVVWIMVLSTVMAVINLPITQQVMVQSTVASMRAQGQDVSPEQLQGMVDTMSWVGSILAYASSIFTLLLIAIVALLIWVMAAVMGGKGATFGRAFAVASGAAVIRPLLYGVYVSVILNMNPPEIRRPQDASTMTPTLGLDLILAGPDTPAWLTVLYQRIDLFNLWYLALLVGGSMAVLKLKKGQAITLAAIIWFIGTAIAVGGALLQSLAAG